MFRFKSFDDFFKYNYDFLSEVINGGRSYFPVDCIEKDDEFVVTADLPGIRNEDIKIMHKNSSSVTINARRECPKEYSEFFNMFERPCGDMTRTIHFPRLIRETSTKARLEQGVLTVISEKETKTSQRTVPIDIE